MIAQDYLPHCKQEEKVETTGSLSVHSRKTELAGDNKENKANTYPRCPILKADHTLNVCSVFRAKPLQERKDILREHGFCYKCCVSKHLARDCEANIKCELCGNARHTTAMHPDQGLSSASTTGGTVADGGEMRLPSQSIVDSKCSKTVYHTGQVTDQASLLPM